MLFRSRVLRADHTEVEIKESIDDDDIGENIEMQVVNDLDRNPSGYSEEEGSLNDTIDMIFGNDTDSDDYKYNDDDYTDSYDDED